MTILRASAAATAARMKSARRSASRSTFQSLEDKQVTVRERDSMQQIRIPIAELKGILAAKLAGEPLTEGTHAWRAGGAK